MSGAKQVGEKRLFLDCGAHDGCSVIKWKLLHPEYEIISFEGNPELWNYFSDLPTTLVRKLVTDFDGEIKFFIDPVDADGSSVIHSKTLDATGLIKNEDCPSMFVECVDVSRVVREKSEIYGEIVLKLDVEGAEYAILQKMLKDGTIQLVNKIFAEFHWEKIGLAKERHDWLIKEILQYVDVEFWGAEEYQIHKKSLAELRKRHEIVKSFNIDSDLLST